jgi:hypothetical protein
LPDQRDIQSCFFLCLSHGGVFEGFAVIHKATGDGPSEGWIFAFDQDNSPAFNLDDDVHRRKGVSVTFRFRAAVGATSFYFSSHRINDEPVKSKISALPKMN